ncbi:MAG: MmcQ/YjbR family DNA-binding protein [Bacteroidota bacterium]
MDLEKIRNICLNKKGVEESFPFDEETLVFKVAGKMFCLLNLEPPHIVNVKCDPEKAIELRELYDYVIPGYHMNKKHWNTIELDKNVDYNLLLEWIDDSYNLIVGSLSKKAQEDLKKTI